MILCAPAAAVSDRGTPHCRPVPLLVMTTCTGAVKRAPAVAPPWRGGIRASNARCACSSSAAVKESRLTSIRLCDCGGQLRYKDARRHRLPGVTGHRWVCETCGAAKTRWGAATPAERHRERLQSRRSSAKVRNQIRDLIAQAKNQPCADCGGRFPTCAMDLDHVRGHKQFKVSEAVQKAYGVGLARVRAEIAKCDVVCANCHRIRTERAGYTVTSVGRTA